MQLIIKNGKVIATHPDYIRLTQEQYLGCEIIFWKGQMNLEDDDPRTEKEKREYYKVQRRMAYPSIEDQLDLMYWDQVNGTENWVIAIAIIKAKYPKVE